MLKKGKKVYHVTNAELHYKKMTETPVAKLIISMGIPTTISMLITNIYNMADTYFVGSVGESAQAATGVMFTLQAIIQGVGYLLGHGSGSYVSKFLADKDTEQSSAYLSTAFYTAAAFGLTLMTVGLIFLEPMVILLGSTETIRPHAMDYGLWILIACPFILCSLILNIGLRYEGKAFYAMFGLTAGGLLNILGDYILVHKFHMGVYGAGLATAVSQMISFLILLVLFLRMAQSKLQLRYISRRATVYLDIFRVGLPSLIRQSMNALTTGILNNMTKPFGDAAIAAMSVVSKYAQFLMCVGLGMGQSYQPFAAFNYQAKKYDRVKKGLIFLIVFALVFIGSISLVSIFLAEPIIALFQTNPDVIEVGAVALRFYAVGMIFMAFSVPVNMLYQSIQKANISSALSLMRAGAITIPLLLILVPMIGITGVQIAQPAADVISGVVSIPFIIHFVRTDPKE